MRFAMGEILAVRGPPATSAATARLAINDIPFKK
jgi:hypothetical protein